MDENNSPRFSEDTQKVLLAAGWQPGRFAKNEMALWTSTLTQMGYEFFQAASEALGEFGGLNIIQRGPGIELARESFILDPFRGEHSMYVLGYYSKAIGEKLFPLGEYGNTFSLVIGESGKIYSFDGGLVFLEGTGIDDALEHMIRGFGAIRLPVDIEEDDN